MPDHNLLLYGLIVGCEAAFWLVLGLALAAVVERAFSLNGLGSYLVSAAASKDFAVVQGISLVLVTGVVVINALVDIAYALLDPRVKLGERAK